MPDRDEVSRRVLSLTLFMFLLILTASGRPVTDLDRIGHHSSTAVSEPEKRGMFRAGTPHGPILINGDDNFTTTALVEGWPGDGSPENPFIIDGLDIDVADIRNTRVSFTVRNCNLIGGRLFGIRLKNVKNGEIVNNTCSYNDYGIYLRNSSSNTVVNNDIRNGGVGICVEESASNLVANNNCTSNMVGISLEESASNTVANNTCNNNQIGIRLYYSNSTTVANNACTNFGTNFGIYLMFSDYSIVVNNICTSNRGGIYLENSNSNTVASNICSNNGEYGILLGESDFNIVSDNTCNSNSDCGIRLEDSYSNTVVNNTCLGNPEYDIYIRDSDSNTVANNIIGITKEFVTVVLLLIGLAGISLLGVGWRRASHRDNRDDIIVPAWYRLISWLRMRRPISHADVDESLEHDSSDQ